MSGKPARADRVIEDLLAGPVGQGLLRIARAGEEPAALGMIPPPVSFQFLQEPLGQHGVAVLASLALLDPDLARATVQVLGPQVAGFVEAQASAVNGHEEGAMLGIGAAQVEQALDLRHV